MEKLSLFLGFKPDPLFKEVQKKTNPHLAHLITSGGAYLEEISLGDAVFLGKKATVPLDMEKLELLESNVISLLKKLAPNYSFSSNPLVLVPLADYL